MVINGTLKHAKRKKVDVITDLSMFAFGHRDKTILDAEWSQFYRVYVFRHHHSFKQDREYPIQFRWPHAVMETMDSNDDDDGRR